MAAKLIRLTHKIAIQLHVVAESCIICSSRSKWPVQKLLDIPSLSYSLSRIIFEKRPSYDIKKEKRGKALGNFVADGGHDTKMDLREVLD
jgi:hypothetical protein